MADEPADNVVDGVRPELGRRDVLRYGAVAAAAIAAGGVILGPQRSALAAGGLARQFRVRLDGVALKTSVTLRPVQFAIVSEQSSDSYSLHHDGTGDLEIEIVATPYEPLLETWFDAELPGVYDHGAERELIVDGVFARSGRERRWRALVKARSRRRSAGTSKTGLATTYVLRGSLAEMI